MDKLKKLKWRRMIESLMNGYINNYQRYSKYPEYQRTLKSFQELIKVIESLK